MTAYNSLSQFDPSRPWDDERLSMLQLTLNSEALVGLMSAFFERLDTRRSDDFSAIAADIARARQEIRDIRPHEIAENGLPSAGAELAAITGDTEVATNAIMTAAEAILGMDTSTPGLKAAVDDKVMAIFEACAFQDITGQRVSKIVKVLERIEERISHLADSLGIEDSTATGDMTAEEKRRHDLLLNGPAIAGPETKQDEIDALFDIDSLFE
jgi:hypothetical protein